MSAVPALAAPTGVSAAAGNNQLTVSWTAAAGAASYNIYYGTVAGVTTANQTKVIGATSGSAITGLVNGTKYYVAVTSVNASGESVVSSEVNATPVAPPPPPSAPKGVSITSGNAQATLTWQTVTGATSYNVYYRTSPGVTIANGTKIANTSSGTPITGLTNGTAYYFVVVAEGAGGEGAESSEVGATPTAPAAGVPSGLTASGGVSQVTLGWSAVTGASSYNVYYGTTAGVTTANGTKITGTTSGSAIFNLTNGTQYYFVVTAMSNANTIENPASAEISATPQGIPNLMGGAIQKPLTLTGTVTTVNTVDATGNAFSLWYPTGLTTDGTSLFLGYANNSSYQVDLATYKATIRGIGPAGSTGFIPAITTDGSNLYVPYACPDIYSYSLATSVRTILAGNGACQFMQTPVDGTGTAAIFRKINGITTDGTNLYVTDENTIRKIVIATGVVTTLAGTAGQTGTTDAIGAAARFNNPQGITTDGTNLYVADTGNNLIRKVVIADGTVTTVAGGFLGLTYDGTGAGAKFNAPRGITTDGTNLYVADTGNHTIRKIVIASGVVTTIAGSPGVNTSIDGIGAAAGICAPVDITTDGASLYVRENLTSGGLRKIQ